MSGIDEVPPAGVPTFGDELRKEREMRGISLKEIADATKISKRFLEAIERNDLKTLPAPVFTRGFVREYARYLGLNADDMVTRYGDFISTLEEPIGMHEPPPPVRPVPAPAAHSSARGIVLVAVVLTVVAAAALIAFRIGRGSGKGPKNPAPPSVSTQSAAPLPAEIASTTTVAAAPAEGLNMEIRFNEKTWLSATADGKPALNDEFEPGQTRNLRANDAIIFKTLGNAGGVEITVNGARIRPLGESGDVVHNLRFDKASLEELKSRT